MPSPSQASIFIRLMRGGGFSEELEAGLSSEFIGVCFGLGVGLVRRKVVPGASIEIGRHRLAISIQPLS
jgi:hypothetical protein